MNDEPHSKTEASLLPQHLRLIEASAIHADVALARGYRSVETKAELRRLGFGVNQARVPALLIPVWNIVGEIVLYQIRPDEPRIVKGKPVKYETPAGARMVIDVPPAAREWLRDPRRPLFVTEGIRKADAAVSKGLACIALLGVWNWRGSNEFGGKAALADWESIALNDRMVFIVFDSDVVQKPEVQAAMVRLKAFLESRHAKVHIIHLPPGPLGEKVGLDDYLAGGNAIDLLFGLPSSETPTPEADEAETVDEIPYRVDRGRICFIKETRDGPVLHPLCNFDARVTEEVLVDDGCEVNRAFMVEGRLNTGKALPPVRIVAERFGRMDWVVMGWGLDAVVSAGMSAKDRLREAVQRLSPEAHKRRVFAHTGWREIDGRWLYLTASGAVGADGVNVELGEGLSRYDLPRDPRDTVSAMRTSLDLLGIGPAAVTFPLWAGVFRAPLASSLALDLAMWIEGITGSLKSTVAALFLAHFGSFDRTCLPGNWSSTVNALEKHAFTLKDALYVVDDFAPAALDRRELETKAARLLRAQGNLAGRSRLRPDLSERAGYPPRGLILGTGEQRPAGRSILARTFVLELDRRMINFDQLNVSQGMAEKLPHGMAGYVQWLAPQMLTLRTALAGAFRDARARASATGSHLRIPEALAHLWIGLDCGLSYAAEIGACSLARADELRQQGWEALVARASAQGLLLEDEKPTRIFLQILSTLVVQKRVQIVRKDQPIERDYKDSPAIGWCDDEYLYLLPEAAFQVVSHFARDSGEMFPVSEQALRRDLVRDEIAVRDKGRMTVVARVGGGSHRVLKLRRAAIEAVLGADLAVPLPVVTDVTGSGD